MVLKVIKQINVDFQYSKYISVNAKRYDKESRFVLVTCYNHGDIFPIDNISNYAFIRYKKSDDLYVFNSCEITNDGKVLVELTEQMLAVYGKCVADLVIVHNEPVSNPESVEGESILTKDGELVIINEHSIISTMSFYINVIDNSYDNIELESSYEYNALNDLLIKATTDYAYVIDACKKSEVNAKESEDNAKISENNSKLSEDNAKSSEAIAKLSEDNAKLSEDNAKTSEDNASEFATNAKLSEDNAKTSETNANLSELNAKQSEENAKLSEANAKQSEENAKLHEENANASANISEQNASKSLQYVSESAINVTTSSEKAKEAYDNMLLSKSYAIGGTGERTNEDTDNSQYYYSKAKSISDNIEGSFSPMGTIEFAELQSINANVGEVYHIKDSFVTDNTFKSGAGISHPAGTNIYYTLDGYWDCFVNETLNIIDDDEGNVEIVCSYDFITTYKVIDSTDVTISELINRIKALEEQSVLEVVD